MTYNKLMDQTALPVYETLAELLEAELALAAEAAAAEESQFAN